MKKQLLSMLLSLTVCSGIMPMAAFARDTDPQQQDKAPIVTQAPQASFKTEPAIGELVDRELIVPKDAHYKIAIPNIRKEIVCNGERVFRQCFNSDHYSEGVYEVEFFALPEQGYRFPAGVNSLNVSLGDQTEWAHMSITANETGTSIFGYGMFYLGDVPEKTFLTDINLEATIAEPKVGESPDYSVQVPEDAKYTAKIVGWDWLDGVNIKTLEPGEKIKKGTRYFATIEFIPKDGYYFSKDDPTIVPQVSDENGLQEAVIQNHYRHPISYLAQVEYKTDDYIISNVDMTFRRPKSGDKKSDMPFPIVSDDQKEKYEVTSVKYTNFLNRDFEIFEKNFPYTATITLTPKEDYEWAHRPIVAILDQYGAKLSFDGFLADRKPTDPLVLEVVLRPTTGPLAIFHLENGHWNNGGIYNLVEELTEVDGKKVLLPKQIPTKMYPSQGYGNGSWDVDPYEHCNDITEDTYFTYRYKELKESATVTLKIVNGKWSSATAPTLTDEDIVIEVPLVDGKGTIDSSKIPNHVMADKGCIPDGTWDVDFDALRFNVTDDITCTYTCPRVVTEPITYTISFDGNGATSGEVPEPVSVVSDAAFCSVKIPAATTLEREGYKFKGWNTQAGGAGRGPVGNEITVRYDESDLTLYAQWEKLDKRTIEFVAPDAQVGTVPENITLYPNEDGEFVLTIPETPVPVREGYLFTGYQLVPVEEQPVTTLKAAPTLYQPGEEVVLGDASGYRLVAQWAEHKITLTYDANGGAGAPAAETKTAAAGKADFVVSDVIPARDGYTFAGWGTEMEEPLEVYAANDALTLKEDKTLYAQWKKVEELDPENPDKPDPEKPDPENPDKPDPQPEPKPETKPEPKPETKPELKPDAPNTGDAGMLMPVALMMAASGAATVLLSRKRKHH